MLRNIRKFKPFLYPAAFVLIAGFAFVYKTVLKGNADYFIRTYRSGKVTAVTSQQTTQESIKVTAAASSSEGTSQTDPVQTVQVYICGAVNSPGVYTVVKGTILNDAVEKAGGFAKDAAVTSMNLVYEINSNMSFYIPTVKEAENGNAQDAGVIRGKDSFIWGSGEDASQTKTSGKVNINTADLAALQTLPGVGEATARAIIDYRSKTPFKKPDDLKKVSGIGDAKFERVKAFITV
jgi:competence protein ComEA